jgi:DNA-binding YbaB/EbfC family protein
MKDIMGMMGKVKEMQAKMATMQEEMEQAEVTGVAGGDMVSVTLTGKGLMQGISIDPSLMNADEQEILEDLIVAAHNDARQKVDELTKQKTEEVTAGLPIPPGMKLPF